MLDYLSEGKKAQKLGGNSLFGFSSPPPPSDNSELFKFQKLFNKATLPPLGPNKDIFAAEDILAVANFIG